MYTSATATIQLINQLARLFPEYQPAELLRMGLLVAVHHGADAGPIADHELRDQCQAIALQLGAASDQHAAVSEELDSLAATSPCQFSPQHVFMLVRAIKIQSQVLNLYLGPVETPHT